MSDNSKLIKAQLRIHVPDVGTTLYIWYMKSPSDYMKIGHPDFSHWVTKNEDGTDVLVIVNNKTSAWEFYNVALQGMV